MSVTMPPGWKKIHDRSTRIRYINYNMKLVIEREHWGGRRPLWCLRAQHEALQKEKPKEYAFAETLTDLLVQFLTLRLEGLL